jgi:hypothetical protein
MTAKFMKRVEQATKKNCHLRPYKCSCTERKGRCKEKMRNVEGVHACGKRRNPNDRGMQYPDAGGDGEG